MRLSVASMASAVPVLSAGDRALVVGGLTLSKSPNLGKEVTVISAQGEHSRHGRIWRCEGTGICQMNDSGDFVDFGWADFPTKWLVKIEPTERLKNETEQLSA